MAKLDTKAQILKTGLLKEAASPRLVKLEENQVMQANGKYKIIPKFCGIVAKCGERQDNPYKKGGCLDNHSNGGLEDLLVDLDSLFQHKMPGHWHLPNPHNGATLPHSC